MRPKVGVIIGSKTDLPIVKKALDMFEKLEVPFDIIIASAHRTPSRVIEWAGSAQERGLEIIVAAAGGAAHLAGVVAAHTILPVIGLPLDTTHLRGQDALYSMTQMPSGVPIATVGINSAMNAALLATHILSIKYAFYQRKLREYRQELADSVEKHNEEIAKTYPIEKPKPKMPASKSKTSPRVVSISERIEKDFQEYAKTFEKELAAVVPIRKLTEDKKKDASKSTASETKGKCLKVNPVIPEVKIIEKAMEVLLNGGVVAFPTDTVYGIAVDGTNPKAVENLFKIKERDPERSIPLLVSNLGMLKNISSRIPKIVERKVDTIWPGALTLIVPKHKKNFSTLSGDETLGVRIPDNTICLSVISMVERPLATTSANISGKPPATSAEEVEEYFGNNVDLILDGGVTRGDDVSTVLDVTEKKFRILRQGAISREQLADIFGEKIEGHHLQKRSNEH